MSNQWLSRWLPTSLQQRYLLPLVVAMMFAVVVIFADILLPASLALIAAYLLERPVSWLERISMRRTYAVGLMMLAVIGLIWWLLASLLPIVWQQSQALILAFPELVATGRLYLEQFWSAQANLINDRQLTLLMQRLESQTLNFLNSLLASSLTGVAGIFYALVYLVLLPMMVFFLLKDKNELLADLQQTFPQTSRVLAPVWQELDHQLLGYIQGKLIELILLALACYGLFSFFTLPYALLLALLVGFSVFIPYLGIAVVTIPVALVTIGHLGMSSSSSWLFLIYLAIQLLDAYVLVPMLFGRVVDINPFYIMLAVLVFGGLFGFWGVVFAIPLASLIKVLLHAYASEP